MLGPELDRIAPYSAIERALSRLAIRVPLAVSTGATRRTAETILRRTRLLAHFRVVVGGDEVPAPKPSPAGILLACARLGVAPERCVYVGDSAGDMLAARSAGALAVAAAWGHEYDDGANADLVLTGPDELPALLAGCRRSRYRP